MGFLHRNLWFFAPFITILIALTIVILSWNVANWILTLPVGGQLVFLVLLLMNVFLMCLNKGLRWLSED